MVADVDLRFGIFGPAQVAIAAVRANQGIDGGQLGVRSDVVGGGDIELGPHDTEHASLVVNETAWSELG